jgi:mRNA-degrading endonuclease RelE of RelBE toxin-antitoxin system
MKFFRTERFKKQYKKLPLPIKQAVKKQLALLADNPDHPSLNIKKMQDPRNIWEGRITKSYRFTFQIEDDTYLLRNFGPHDILNKP